MSPTLLYRIASVLLILFAVGHTVGFLKFRPASPEGRAVFEEMNHVEFQVGRASFTYGRFYTGFGLFATAYLLFAAFLAWYLGMLARVNPTALGSLAWGFFTLQVVTLILSRMYFLWPPTVFSALLATCTGWAALMLQTAKA